MARKTKDTPAHVDLSGIRKFTPEEFRHRRSEDLGGETELRYRGTNKLTGPRPKTKGYYVKLNIHLHNRAKYEIGEGNFTRAITVALKEALDKRGIAEGK